MNIKSFVTKQIYKKLISLGFSNYSARTYSIKLYTDLFENKKTSLTQKFWAYKRGFLSRHISQYGLTDSNYNDYLSEYDYDWLHPINGPFSKWIDDKLSIKYILQPFTEYLPEYYFHIYNSEIIRLMNCPNEFGHEILDVINLLKTKRFLSAKLQSGSGGMGFFKLEFDGQDYRINNTDSSENEVKQLIDAWLKSKKDIYLITEYIQSHQYFHRFFEGSPCTVRIIVMREKNQPPRLGLAQLRIGTEVSGAVDNTAAGGIACRVDTKSGFFSNGQMKTQSGLLDCKYHPNTNVLLEGTLPNWEKTIQKIINISSYIPQVRFMGYDVIITNDGFKILEINSKPDLGTIQSYLPILSDEEIKRYFTNLIEEKNKKLAKL